jgi:hypothetical protein
MDQSFARCLALFALLHSLGVGIEGLRQLDMQHPRHHPLAHPHPPLALFLCVRLAAGKLILKILLQLCHCFMLRPCVDSSLLLLHAPPPFLEHQRKHGRPPPRHRLLNQRPMRPKLFHCPRKHVERHRKPPMLYS